MCDLLAVFEDHVFIFFDRESRHLDKFDKDPPLAWMRWRRVAIDDQIRTASGAERYLRSGRPIFVDQERTNEFPIRIDRESMILHKIIVAHGAAEACRSFSEFNVNGSLGVAYGKAGVDVRWPFLVELDRDHPVHILDDHNLEIIMGELDTIFDLSTYLDAKIEAIRRYDCLIYCGEEDLLAHYFLNFDVSENRHFIGTNDRDINCLMIGEGEWKGFIEAQVYKRKKDADRPSYLWDRILQKTTKNALDGKLLGRASFLRGQSAMHEMAKEPRFSRRALATSMIESHKKFSGKLRAACPKFVVHAFVFQGQGVHLPSGQELGYR